MIENLAFITILLWPVIPLFWIPVHLMPGTFRNLGIFTYIMPLFTWLPLAFILYNQKEFLLKFTVNFHIILKSIGVILLITGTLLHMWTGKLLGARGLIGLPEISHRIKGRLVTEGAFSFVRHPTYLAHTIMLSGIFLMTGVIAVGAVTLLDFLLINVIIIPLEEREISARFGEEFQQYKKNVPKIFPGFHN
jgi:protein-S-isoprenylcysteine O-methyltransferase Ste14